MHIGATATHIACKYENPNEVYLIGMVYLRSDTKYYNNIYKGSKHYSSAHYEPSPIRLYRESEWLQVMKDNR